MWREGQFEPEGRPLAARTLDADAPSVALDDRAADGEAQSKPHARSLLLFDALHTIEPLEEPSLLLAREARPFVAHADPRPVTHIVNDLVNDLVNGDIHRLLWRRIFQRIREEDQLTCQSAWQKFLKLAVHRLISSWRVDDQRACGKASQAGGQAQENRERITVECGSRMAKQMVRMLLNCSSEGLGQPLYMRQQIVNVEGFVDGLNLQRRKGLLIMGW